MRRHRAATVLIALALVLVALVTGWAAYLNLGLGKMTRISVPGIAAQGQGTGRTGVTGRAVNVLIAGTDSRDPGEVARMVRTGWVPGGGARRRDHGAAHHR